MIAGAWRPPADLRRAGCRLLLGKGFRQAEAACALTQWLPGDAMRERQWKDVLEILHAAEKAGEFYRSRLGAVAGQDLPAGRFAEIPPMTREEIRRHTHEIVSPASRRAFTRASGGTGGAGVAIPIDRDTYSWYVAGMWRGFSWWGVDLAQRVVLLLGASRQSPLHALLGAVKDWALRWRRVPVDEEFDERASDILERIIAYDPAALYGYPSAVYRLAGAHRRTPAPPWHLKVIVLTGEPVYAFQRRRIEEAFQCPVAEEYGMGELGSVAFECRHGRLHVSAETVFVEVVPAGAGFPGAGRILATHLRNRLVPLIRYDTGDIGTMFPEPCPCGRSLPVLRVLGRAADHLVWAGGAMPARLPLERLFGLLPEPLQGHVRLLHSAPGAVTLEVERNGTDAGADLARAAAAAASVLGPDWTVHARPGRFRRVRSGKLPYFVRG